MEMKALPSSKCRSSSNIWAMHEENGSNYTYAECRHIPFGHSWGNLGRGTLSGSLATTCTGGNASSDISLFNSLSFIEILIPGMLAPCIFTRVPHPSREYLSVKSTEQVPPCKRLCAAGGATVLSLLPAPVANPPEALENPMESEATMMQIRQRNLPQNPES